MGCMDTNVQSPAVSALEINRAILSMESVQTAVSMVTGVKDAYMVNIGLAIEKFSCVCLIDIF